MKRRTGAIDRVYRMLEPTLYGELPVTDQLAIVRYMSVDGEAWDPPAKITPQGLRDALKLAMSRSCPPAKAVSEKWRLPGGAGRESGGPT